MIDQSYVQSILEYNKHTGNFIWLKSRGGLAKKGSIAGSLDSKGYSQIKIKGKLYLAHRLAWLYEYGFIPESHLDHIDRNPRNNAIENLRICTHVQNHQNTNLRIDSISGITGVAFIKNSSKWLAYININGLRKRLGMYESKADAVAARLKAKAEIHTFHPFQSVTFNEAV